MEFFDFTWLNELFDLSAVAGGAGVAGGTAGAGIAWWVRGVIYRFILRVIATGVVTGIGFYFALGALGFQIVPVETASESQTAVQRAYSELGLGFDGAETAEIPAMGRTIEGEEEEEPKSQGVRLRSPFRNYD